MGYELLLQIHDEVILEGPSESAEEALQIVVDTMVRISPVLLNLSWV